MNTIEVGTKVQDVNIVRRYGASPALIGTVTRIYDSPVGMVEVEWETGLDDNGTFEDVWTDELVLANRR